VRIVCTSDTHLQHDRVVVPDGDVLVHAGDFCGHGTVAEVRAFDDWLSTLPHPYRVVIAGNHDWPFERTPLEARAALRNAIYLEDSGVEIGGIRFWGSPWQPEFMNWAFNLPRGAALAEKWALIPDDTDVVITHGPPRGYGDRCVRDGFRAGCEELLTALERCRARLHVGGHIHEGYGVRQHGAIRVINASACDLRYRPVNPPIVVDLAERTVRNGG
jgi:Icc-related predicted phosphoesterase